MSCLRASASLMLCHRKMNGMKAQGMLGFRVISTLAAMIIILAAFASMAEEQPPVSAPQEQPSSIPVLSARLTNDTLALSWPKSATNWMLSTQSIDARGWSPVTATQYGTNATDIYVTTPLPAKTTFYRLIKVPPGFRNRALQPAQLPALPPLPKPGAKPPRPPGTPPPPHP